MSRGIQRLRVDKEIYNYSSKIYSKRLWKITTEKIQGKNCLSLSLLLASQGISVLRISDNIRASARASGTTGCFGLPA